MPIAEAAAKSGFDCSDWNTLKRLIDSVKGAVQSTYPDKYTGQAALKSRSQYRLRPDNYRPRYDDRQLDNFGRLSPYIKPDERSDSSDGSFHSAQTFLTEPRPRLQSHELHPLPSDRSATGTDRVPLGPKSMNARIVPGEHAYAPPSAPINEMLIEVAARKRYAQSSLKTSRPAAKRLRIDWDAPRVDQANAAPATLNYSDPIEDPREQQLPMQLPPDDLCRTRTRRVLTKCASKLQVAVKGIQTDRDRLSQRWEADDALRSQTVTDAMAELNSHFFEAETNLQAAISVVDDRLLGEERL